MKCQQKGINETLSEYPYIRKYHKTGACGCYTNQHALLFIEEVN